MESHAYVRQTLAPERPPLRMAVVTETYPPEINGVAMTLGHLVRGLQARGHTIELIRPRQGASDTPDATPGVEEVLARAMPIPRYDSLKLGLPARAWLKRLWRAQRPDLVHVVTEGPLGWSAVSAARSLRIPVTSDFHTHFEHYTAHYGFAWLEAPVARYLRRLHNRTATTFVPTRALQIDLHAHGYLGVEVIARGVDTQLFSPARRRSELRRHWGANDGDLVALYVGRLAPEKNLPAVLRAFEALQRQTPARLVFVGDGPARGELEASRPWHYYAGARVGEDLAEHYASADVFLFPSLTETFGNVTLEAMASGLGVVAYRQAGAAELIRHGEDGLLAAPGDELEFIAHAEQFAQRPAILDRLRQQARRAAMNRDWRDIVLRYEDAFLRHARPGGLLGNPSPYLAGST